MSRLKSVIYILSLIWIMLALSACVDEGLERYADSNGDVLVNLEAAFSPFAEADLTRASNEDPERGGFNSISDIAFLVFDADGKLLSQYLHEVVEPNTVDGDRDDSDSAYGRPNQENPDYVDETAKSAESVTKKITNIPLLVPSGTYYIIAVANFGKYKTENNGDISIQKDSNGKSITSLSMINQKIEEKKNKDGEDFILDDLRRLKVDWDTDDYANNRAMMGYFSLSGSTPHAGSKFETVSLDRSGLKPHAWLRRCASKITVDFDGSGLSENVSIFIKDVRVFDIAKDCTLGFGNPAKDDENLEDFNNKPTSYEELTQRPDQEYKGQYIKFGEGNDVESWPRISKHTPFITNVDGTKRNLHTQDSKCLYFYENMQGTKEGYDRSPIPNLYDGGVAEGYNKKDGVPYGTYIEVSVRHVVEEDGESHSSNIKYRFMLGKNVTNNFDAERNFHYKLTLAFVGSANEHHWHIDYEREEGFKVPNPWYVSYGYNKGAYLPFEFNLEDDWELYDLDAKIVTNPWYPSASNSSEGADVDFSDPTFEIKPATPTGDPDDPYQTADNKYTGNGFLSLRAPSEESVLTDTRVGTPWPQNAYNTDAVKKINQKYFDGEDAGIDSEGRPVAKVNHGYRTIIKNANVYSDGTESDNERISVSRNQGVYSINIPLFTRERALIKQTGYSGSNPFVGYQRVAKVKLTGKARNKNDHSLTKEFTDYVNVVQVRRVVNPVGVYRKIGNNMPFQVKLMFLTSEGKEGIFEPIISRGPWMAEILGDNNFITLDGNQRVSGSSRSEIDFTIRFNRMGGSGNRNAIVRIKYHNYTCTHLIFVRQGYDPQAICDGGPVFNNDNAPATKWNTFNMIAGDKIAEDPRDEGSLFKFGNPDDAFSSIDNVYKDASGFPIYHEQTASGFIPHETLTILRSDGSVNGDKNKWSEVSYSLAGFANAKNNDNSPMEISHAATMRDFEQLYLTKHIEFGYGVLYADGATETQSTLEMVNGWYRDDPSPEKNKKGMRGVFAYYWNPNDPDNIYCTRNIFFPIGRSGYGHRKEKLEESQGKGILRYCSNRYGVANVFYKVAPLFSCLYRRMGAIYWSRSLTEKKKFLEWNGKQNNDDVGAYGLDMNYFTFDVNAITNGGNILGNGADACFVRTVYESAGD